MLLALVHLLLWDVAGSGHSLALGDNLTGVLDPGAEAFAFKMVVAHSSLLTGVGMGLILGTISLVSQKVKKHMTINS